MKILILTTKFTHLDGSPWLVSELAQEFCDLGHEVTVLNVAWDKLFSCPPVNDISPNIKLVSTTVLQTSKNNMSRGFKWFFSSFLVVPFLLRALVAGRRYDLLIGFSPCLAVWSALPLAAALCRDRFLVYWDFFPVHNTEISPGVPTIVKNFAKLLERSLIRRFNHVGLMSQRNLEYFHDYFCFAKQNVAVKSPKSIVLPIWTSILQVKKTGVGRTLMSFGSERIVFVFGGQLIHGRCVRELCEAILMAYVIDNRVALVICGSGNLSSMVSEYAEKHPSCIEYLGNLPRNDYLAVVSASNVGVVATVPGVSVPTYPSKSLDYMSCGIPIMAAVEKSTDFGEIVELNGLGRQCKAGDIDSMKNCMIDFARSTTNRRLMGRRGADFLAAQHSVSHASSIILGAVSA